MDKYYNADPQQVRQQTKYPFTNQSTLKIDNHLVQPSWFKSMNIQVSSAVFPLYISGASSIFGRVTLQISDQTDTVIAHVQLNKEKGYGKITQLNGYRCGTISHNTLLYQFFRDIAETQRNKHASFDKNSMRLCPDCISCVYIQGCKAIRVQNNLYNGLVQFHFDRNITVQCDVLDLIDQTQTINVYGNMQGQLQYLYVPQQEPQTPEQPEQLVQPEQPVQPQIELPIYLKTINGVDLSDFYVIVKHKQLSNLRVIASGTAVTLAGVLDA